MIGEWRKDYKTHKDKIAKARRLYIRFCRQAIMLDRTEKTLLFCAERMILEGLYAPSTSLFTSAISILGHLHRFDKQNRLTWHQWTNKNGWHWWCHDIGTTPQRPVIRKSLKWN